MTGSRQPSSGGESARGEIVLRYDTLGSGHPSGLWLLFDVRLTSAADRPRWFLLPSHVVADATGSQPFSVIAAEVWRLNARHSIPHVHFVGSEGFQAFLLPPHASIRVEHLPVVWFGEPPRGTVTLRCAIADDIAIEDEPAASWLAYDVMSPASATADYDLRDIVASRVTATSTEQPVTLKGVRPVDVTTSVTLGR